MATKTNWLFDWTDTSLKHSFVIEYQSVNSTASSLRLAGKSNPDWGEINLENTLRLLEHFASNNKAPDNPTVGQLWFNATTNRLRVFDKSQQWVDLRNRTYRGHVAPTGTFYAGDLWYDTSKDLLKVYDINGKWVQVGATSLPGPTQAPTTQPPTTQPPTQAPTQTTTQAPRPTATITQYTYTEDLSVFMNPERGFVVKHVISEASPLSLTQATSYKNNGNSMVWLIGDLKSFKSSPLSDGLLQNLQLSFNAIRSAGLKCILKFQYDTSEAGADAPLSRIVEHINQLEIYFSNNVDVIAHVNVGFIGTNGDWTFSSNFGNIVPNAVNYGLTAQQWSDRKAVVDKLLQSLPPQRSVSLRAPFFKRKMYGSEALPNDQAFTESVRSRIGHYNTSFVSSTNDNGTYVDQAAEYEYLKQETKWLPMGGESSSYTVTRSDCPTAQSELAQFHWSWLNQYDHAQTIEEWKAQNCFEAISKQLGYRLLLTSSELQTAVVPGTYMRVLLRIKNIGYAAPFNAKVVRLVLQEGASKFTLSLPTIDPRRWLPGEHLINESVWVPAEVPNGNYTMYLHIADPEQSLIDRPEYSIRLSNQNAWSATTGYNSLNHTIAVAASLEESPPPPSAPYLISWSSKQDGTNVTETIYHSLPSGTEPSDLMIWVVSYDKSIGLTFPDGWTKIHEQIGYTDEAVFAVATRVATNNEPSSYSMSLPEINEFSSLIVTYRGVNPMIDVSASGMVDTPMTSPWLTPSMSLTTSVANTRVLWFAAVDNVTLQTPLFNNPTGFQTVTTVTDSEFTSVHLAHKTQDAIGTTGPVFGSASGIGTAATAGALIVLKNDLPTAEERADIEQMDGLHNFVHVQMPNLYK